MTEDSRTLLTEHINNRKRIPVEGTTYHITASRLVVMGGFECNRVEAKLLDNYFLLMRVNTVNGFYYEPFSVVDIAQPQMALDRMYNEAKSLAKDRARRDENKVIDLTSRAEKVRGNDKYYVPDDYLQRCA